MNKEKELSTVGKVTESDQIWEEIQHLPIAMFALPLQQVKQHVQRFVVNHDAVYLKLNSPAVVTSLEEALADSRNHKRYTVELADSGYVIVRRAPDPIVIPK